MFLNPMKDTIGIIVILVIVLVIFGPSRLPQLGKSIGDTIRAIRKGSEGQDDEEKGPASTGDKKPGKTPDTSVPGKNEDE